MRKKQIYLLSLLIVCLALFSACGGPAGSGSSSTASNSGNGAGSSGHTGQTGGSANGSTAGNSSGNANSGGTAAGSSNTNSAPVSIEMMTTMTNNVPDVTSPFYTELQKETNTQLKITAVQDGSDYDTKMDLVLASGNLPEVMAARDYNRPTLVNAVNQGAFWDLTPFLQNKSQYPNLTANMTPGSWNYVKYNGKTMGIPRSRGLIDQSILVRQDWLQKYNIPMPQTVDDFKKMLETIVKNDPAGNGSDHTIGYVVSSPMNAASLNAAFGVVDPTYDKKGGMMYEYLTPQFTQLVEWFRGLYSEGLIPKEFATLTGTQQKELFRSGRAVAFDASSYYSFVYTNQIKAAQPGAMVVSTPPLKGPAGSGALLDIGTRGGFYISKKVPEAKVRQILAYFDKTASQPVTDLGYYGKEGVDYNVVNGQKVMTDLGKKEITVDALTALTPAWRQWGKVDYAGATQAENTAKEQQMAIYGKVGKQDPFRWLYSPTWADIWPNYQANFQSMVIKAVVGQISMDEYKNYVDKLNNDPKFQQAYKEFAQDYKQHTQN